MRKRIFFVYNPKSGKAQIEGYLAAIINIFTKSGYEVIAYPTQKEQDAFEKVQEYAGEVDLIVCSGGDGTLDEVVSGLMMCDQKVPLGYIPAGSTNDFANSLKIPMDMEEAAQEIMEGVPFGCDIGAFNRDTFVYIAAFGLFTDVSYQTNQSLKNTLGHAAYVLEGMKRIFDIKSYHMKINASGNISIEDDFIYGMVTNSRSVGGFKNLTGDNVEMDDGLFEVTLIRRPRNILELNEILGALVSGIDNTDMIYTFKTDWMKLESMESVAWTLDGEYGGNHSFVSIENRQKALNLLLNPDKHQRQELLEGNHTVGSGTGQL